MKTMMIAALVTCLVSVLAGGARAEETGEEPTPATSAPQKPAAVRARIGTYDSRAVAVAFVGSEAFRKRMDDLKAEYDKAKAAGDRSRVAQLEAQGRAGQRLRHKQGFSTAPIHDILHHIEDKLPEIEKKAGVVALVSKWDKEELAKHKDAELVDVTMALVDVFEPNDRQRRSAIGIQKSDPISLEQAENIED